MEGSVERIGFFQGASIGSSSIRALKQQIRDFAFFGSGERRVIMTPDASLAHRSEIKDAFMFSEADSALYFVDKYGKTDKVKVSAGKESDFAAALLKKRTIGNRDFKISRDELYKVIIEHGGTTPTTDKRKKFNSVDLAMTRGRRVMLLQHYGKKLAQLDPVTFQYLNKAQYLALEEELLYTFWLYSGEYDLNLIEGRGEHLDALGLKLLLCTEKLNKLRTTSKHATTDKVVLPLEEAMDPNNPVPYLALTIYAPALVECALTISRGVTVSTLDNVSYYNRGRLYWVWAGSLLATIVEWALPQEPSTQVYHSLQQNLLHEKYVLGHASHVGGTLSWAFYFLRLGINLAMIAKHTIPGYWMSWDEYQIPWYERFSAQWEARKFAILNDAIWAPVNLVSFFWLCGAGMPGFYGGIVTQAALLWDIGVACFEYHKMAAAHKLALQEHTDDLSEMKIEIARLRAAGSILEADVLQIQADDLETHIAEITFEWKWKEWELIYGLSYAIALTVAFLVVIAFFASPGAILPATALAFCLAGSALCFLLNVVESCCSENLKVSKLQDAQQVFTVAAMTKVIEKFQKTDDADQRKLLYLDYCRLQSESFAEDKIIIRQQRNVWRDVFLKVFLPAVIGFGYILFPPAIVVSLVAAVLVIALVSYYAINGTEIEKYATPDSADTDEYRRFCLEHDSKMTDTP